VSDLRREEGKTARGVFLRERSDGTSVYVLYGRDDAAMRRMVDEFPP